MRRRATELVDIVLVLAAGAGLGVVVPAVLDEAPGGGTRNRGTKPAATVTELVGNVRTHSVGTLVWESTVVGAGVADGDQVFVAANSEATLVFADGSRLNVGPNTLLAIEVPTAERIGARLVRGDVTAHAGSGARLVLRAGDASTELRSGAAASVSGGGERATVTVHGGKVRVAGKSVTAGEEARLAAGRVVAVASFPARFGKPDAAARIFFRSDVSPPVSFRWSGVPGPATLSFGRDRTLLDPVREVAVEGGEARVESLPRGVLYYRLRDREGKPLSAVRRLVLVRERPPTPLVPRAGAIETLLDGAPLHVQWVPLAGAEGYRIEILGAEGVAPVATLLDVVTSYPAVVFPWRHPEGRYRWRVRALYALPRVEGPPCAFVPFRAVTRPLLGAPELFEPEIKIERRDPRTGAPKSPHPEAPDDRKRDGDGDDGRDGSGGETGSILWWLVGGVAHAAERGAGGSGGGTATIVLRWKAVPGAAAYAVQIAEDHAFERVVLEKRVATGKLSWRKIAHRRYWWRVRTVDDLGRAGPWSAPKEVPIGLPVPVARRPADGARVTWTGSATAIWLEWKPSKLAAHYEIVVAGDPDFAAPVTKLSAIGNSIPFAPPRPSTYFWRVRAIDLHGTKTDFGARRRLSVVLAMAKLHAPAAAAVVVVEEDGRAAIRFTWSAVVGADGYAVEILDADDDGRIAFLKSTTLSKKWSAPPGAYRWRVRARAASGSSVTGVRSITVVEEAPVAVAVPPPVEEVPPPVEEVPPPVEEAVPPAAASVETDAVRRRVGPGVGLRTGVLHNLGAVISPRLGLEVLLRMPWWDRRFALGLLGAVHRARFHLEAPTAPGEIVTTTWIFPVAVTLAAEVLRAGRLDGHLAAGFVLAAMHSVARAEFQPDLLSTGLAPGGIVCLGALYRLGPGGITAEVCYMYAPIDDLTVRGHLGGAVFDLGYRLGAR